MLIYLIVLLPLSQCRGTLTRSNRLKLVRIGARSSKMGIPFDTDTRMKFTYWKRYLRLPDTATHASRINPSATILHCAS